MYFINVKIKNNIYSYFFRFIGLIIEIKSRSEAVVRRGGRKNIYNYHLTNNNYQFKASTKMTKNIADY